MNLVSTVFFTILINGVLIGLIKPSKGIKKWDMLPSFLFIIIVEGIGRSIKVIQANWGICGLKVHPRAEVQTHQQFMDDAMLIGHPSIQEAQAIMGCLQEFVEVPRLEFDEEKSHSFFFNNPCINRFNICKILGFPESSLPSKYLGAPFVDSIVHERSWTELIEKMRNRLLRWMFFPWI